jgi:hypothetical protein
MHIHIYLHIYISTYMNRNLIYVGTIQHIYHIERSNLAKLRHTSLSDHIMMNDSDGRIMNTPPHAHGNYHHREGTFYVYKYVYKYVYISVCIEMYINTYIHLSITAHERMCICMLKIYI